VTKSAVVVQIALALMAFVTQIANAVAKVVPTVAKMALAQIALNN